MPFRRIVAALVALCVVGLGKELFARDGGNVADLVVACDAEFARAVENGVYVEGRGRRFAGLNAEALDKVLL